MTARGAAGPAPRRAALLADLAARIDALPGERIRVGVDGVDGAGKTVFADELGAALTAVGRQVVRSGTDFFHHPRAVRHRRGRTSPDGFYLDSFDYPLIRRLVLDPLGPGGSGEYRAAAFDHVTDRPVAAPLLRAPADAVLVFDGIFLHRKELRDCWDLSVFLTVDFEVSVDRLGRRDGTPTAATHPANLRYVDGQRRYLAECRPAELATVVVDNNDLEGPFVAGPR